jgi:uncharacterized coiled-coil protein SlyX
VAGRRLHAVGSGERAEEPGLRPLRGRATGVLGLLLALVLVLLAATWLRLGNRVAALEAEVATLGAAVAERDRVIEGQARRLADVRDRLDDLGRRVAEARAAVDEPAGN